MVSVLFSERRIFTSDFYLCFVCPLRCVLYGRELHVSPPELYRRCILFSCSKISMPIARR